MIGVMSIYGVGTAVRAETLDSIGAVRDAVSSVSYVPAMPSRVPASAQLWEHAVNSLIKTVGAAATKQVQASDIFYEARRAGIEPNLLLALVEILSRYDARHNSSDRNFGLLQIDPAIQNRFGNPENSLLQAKYNLRLGAILFRHYLDINKGNINLALSKFLTEVSPQQAPEAKTQDVLALRLVRAKALPSTE